MDPPPPLVTELDIRGIELRRKDLPGVAPGSLWYAGKGAKSPRTPGEVDAQMFEVARFGSGYRMREVGDLFDEVAYLIAQLEAENEALRAGRSTSG